MAVRTILFVMVMLGCTVGAVFSPVWPLVGYITHYCVGPGRQWWAAPINAMGIRYSFTFAILGIVAIAMHHHKLRYGTRLFTGHEKLFLLFLGIMWLSTMLGPETVGQYTTLGIDHPSLKMTKVAIFCLMLTHVASEYERLKVIIWTLILGALLLGIQAWETPYSSFVSGRLERVGGPDFAEANFLPPFLGALLWLIGAQFVQSGWRGRAICFVAGGFAANAIVLTRSRGAVVGLAIGGLTALIMAPKRLRPYIIIGLILAAAGFYYLTDERFLSRSTTILATEEERDSSAEARIEVAKAGLRMWRDRPFGVGAGNFYQTIGYYLPHLAGRDAHNTYVRCLTELGAQGFAVFGLIIVSAFLTLRRVRKTAALLSSPAREQFTLLAFGMTCGLATLLGCCLTVSLTYVEYVWWLLLFPVCVERAMDNLLADQRATHMEPLCGQ